MKKRNVIWLIIAVVVIIAVVALVGWYLKRSEPTIIQGTVECTTYKASSKIAGRIEEMKVEQGDHVTKGQLLYVLSTPELDAKLRQAEAVKSAATALDQKALAGARVQQIEAALNMWQKAQAGKELAQKTYDRVKALYDKVATEMAAKAQYDLAVAGASKEDKDAAAAQVQQAEGVVSEVESYISDAMVYAPVDGEVSTIIAEQGELVGTGYPVVAILDTTDTWVTFNIKETLLPKITVGMKMTTYVPALDRNVELEVSYISVQADFATWSATRTQGSFDIRTFAVKARPVTDVENIRPGMSVLVNWDELGK